MSESILIDGNAVKVLFEIENHFVVPCGSNRIVLTKEQKDLAKEINLKTSVNKVKLLNWFIVENVRKVIERKVKSGKRAFLTINIIWGDGEKNERLGIALGYNKKYEEKLISWVKNWGLNFPRNSYLQENINYIKSTKFPEEFVSITVDSSYFSENYELTIDCSDGHFVEWTEKLIQIFPFF